VVPQHRNKALAEWRRARAVELAVNGATYDAIAAEVGFTHRSTAYKTVQRALDQRTCKAVDEYRELEVDRLDALQAAIWHRAVAGDCAAIAVALRIIESRIKILGLGAEKEPSAEQMSVVVGE
jgi:hypothetical protein